MDIDPTLVNCQSVSTPTDGDGTKRFRTTYKVIFIDLECCLPLKGLKCHFFQFIEAVNALRAQNSPYECKDPSPYEVHGDEAVKRRKRGFFKRSESVTIKCEDIAPVSSTEVSPNRPENVTTKCEDVAPICATEVSTKYRDEVIQKRRSVASKCLAEVAPKSRDEVALKSCVVPTSCDLIAPKRSASLQPVQNHVLEVEKPTEEPSRFSSPVQIISPRDAAELSRLLLRPKSFPTPDFVRLDKPIENLIHACFSCFSFLLLDQPFVH